jgi:thiamine pyrophosphate-dependent acetolactate synthase large subunit-like protein
MLGTDFPYRQFLPQRDTVQIDIDPARLGRRTALDLGVVGDVGATIRALLPKLRRSPGRPASMPYGSRSRTNCGKLSDRCSTTTGRPCWTW